MTDISGYNFDAWLDFLVLEDSHCVSADDTIASNFLYKWDRVEVTAHSSELFRRSGEIWRALGNDKFAKVLMTIKITFLPSIVHPKIPHVIAATCVENMEYLFADVFSNDPLNDSCYWWFHFWPTSRYLGDGTTDSRQIFSIVNDSIFALLSKILTHYDNREVRRSALHGLARRMDHIRAKKIIEAFMRTASNVDEDIEQYAMACMRNAVL